jgi:integrase
MAQIERRTGKKGVTYLLTVNSGKDASGRQIRHRRTYTPPQTWSEARQEKEAWKAANEFETEIRQGFALDNRQTFARYAEYALELKRRTGVRESTLERYMDLLERINPEIGHLKLADIRPAHLNKFYERLSKEGGRKKEALATAKIDLSAEIKKRGLSKTEFSRLADVPARAVGQACKAPVAEGTAVKIAAALGGKVDRFFVLERDMTPLSQKTILEHHRLISSILALAEKEMLIPYNPAAKATPPRPVRPEPNYFQPDTIYKILDAADTESLKYRTFVYLAVSTGARRGELAGLKWENVSMSTGQITIDHGLYYSAKRGVYEGETKTGEHRSLKVPTEVLTMLKQLRKEQAELQILNGDRWQNQGYIFTQDDGRPMHPDTWTGWMDSFSKRHGLPHINPHAFRHSAASALIANHVDIVTVSKVLGHTSPTTTGNFYAHMVEDAKAAATDTIADVLIRRKA